MFNCHSISTFEGQWPEVMALSYLTISDNPMLFSVPSELNCQVSLLIDDV